MQLPLRIVLILCYFLHHKPLLGDAPQDLLQTGQQAIQYTAAHFSTGYWAKKGEKFQKKFLCPVLEEVEHTKLAIYVMEANAPTMTLAVELDRAIQQYPQLARSFLIVSEESGAEAMTDDALTRQLGHLQELGKKHGIEKLSMAYLQYSDKPSRWKHALGFFDAADVVVAVIEPGILPPKLNRTESGRLPLRTVKPFYRFAERLKSKDIDQQTAAAVIERALSSLSN